MRQVKRLLAATLALMAVAGLAAATASAENTLPSLLWLSSATKLEIVGRKEAAGGVMQLNSSFLTMKATFMLVQLYAESATQMASSGLAKVLYEGSELSGKACFSEGDALTKGAILIDNAEWHVVLDLSGNPFVRISMPETTIKCDIGTTFKLRGALLEKLSPFATGEVTKFTTEAQCETAGSRKAKWKEYDTDEGMGTAKLEYNMGLGYEEVCVEANPLESTASETTEVMEP